MPSYLRGGIMKRRALIATAVGGLIVAAMAGGVAWATIPDSGGIIHSCFSQATGTWRPIDYPTAKCKSGETQLDFNQKGVKGDTGPQGPQGIQGQPGKDGTNGVDGKDGVDGQDGAPGETGPQGPQGPAGPQGPSGISNYQIAQSPPATVALFDFKSADATCPSGTKPIGGGAAIGSDSGYLEASYPTADGWHVRVHNIGPFADVDFWARAICATVS
jgi:hypothetical protein